MAHGRLRAWTCIAVVLVAGALLAVVTPTGATAQQAPSGSPGNLPGNVAVTEKVAVTDAYQNPSVAADPNNSRRLAVAYHEGNSLLNCYLALSNDGGATWDARMLVGNGGQFPHSPEHNRCWNPLVAYGPDSTLYYVIQTSLPNDRIGDQVKLLVSEDGGSNFRGPTSVDPTQTGFRGYWPAIAVDQRSGRVFIGWSQHVGPPAPGRIVVASSDDKGATFSPPVLVNTPDLIFPAAPQLALAGDGRLYVAYGNEIDNTFYVSVSTDGARSFAAPVLVHTLVPGRVFGPMGPMSGPIYASFGPRYMSIVPTRTAGRAVLAFWDLSGPNGLARISLSSTTDGGGSWSALRGLAVPAGREGDHQYFPWLGVAPNGRIDLAFHMRVDNAEGAQDTYLVSSTDNGAGFSAARRLSDAPGNTNVGPAGFFGQGSRLGDFLGVASLDDGAAVAWTDMRRGNLDDGHQDIFFATTVPPSGGYRLVAADGGVFGFGDAAFLGSAAAAKPNRPVVAAASTPSGRGYWFTTSDGGVFAFGDATFHGGATALSLRQPVVAMAATAGGKGYWLASGDGGVFAFGDARALGTLTAATLTRPIVAMAATTTGRGYWLTASDGGVFAFGDARFLGSTGALRLNKPIVSMAATPTGKGYWLTASDGGVFAFGDARFLGSTGALRLNKPVVSMAATSTGRGYWLTASDGGVFAFGDARFLGSTGALSLNQPIVAMAGR